MFFSVLLFNALSNNCFRLLDNTINSQEYYAPCGWNFPKETLRKYSDFFLKSLSFAHFYLLPPILSVPFPPLSR